MKTLQNAMLLSTCILAGSSCSKKDVEVSPKYNTSENYLKQKIGVVDFQNLSFDEAKKVVNYLDRAPKEECSFLFKLMAKQQSFTYVKDHFVSKTSGNKGLSTSARTATDPAAEEEPPAPFTPDWSGYDPYAYTIYSSSYNDMLPAFYAWTVCTNSFGLYRVMSQESISINDLGDNMSQRNYSINSIQHLGTRLYGFTALASWSETYYSNYYNPGGVNAYFMVAGDVSLKAYRMSFTNTALVNVTTLLNSNGMYRGY